MDATLNTFLKDFFFQEVCPPPEASQLAIFVKDKSKL